MILPPPLHLFITIFMFTIECSAQSLNPMYLPTFFNLWSSISSSRGNFSLLSKILLCKDKWPYSNFSSWMIFHNMNKSSGKDKMSSNVLMLYLLLRVVVGDNTSRYCLHNALKGNIWRRWACACWSPLR